MTKTFAPPSAAIRALPYVSGETTRVKAEPTRLTPLAGKVMMASGALSTRRTVASKPLGRILAAIAFLGLSATLFLDHSPMDSQTQALELPRAEAPLLSVGLFENAEPIVREQRAAASEGTLAEADIDGQDRFEIARLVRLSAIVRVPRRK